MRENHLSDSSESYAGDLHSETAESYTLDQERLRTLAIPILTILCHPDVDRVGDRLPLSVLATGDELALSRLEPAFKPPGQFRGRPLSDKHLSRKPFVLSSVPHEGTVTLERRETKTSLRVDGEKFRDRITFSPERIDGGVVLEFGRRIVLLLHHRPPVVPETPRFGLIGESPGIANVRREIKMLAELEVPVLLRGETGTGKEVVARAIHARSIMREGPWVSVNMAAIPPDLAAAELFGSVKGAFTGADRAKEGFFERAHEGTIMLDEIGEMPVETQVLLLRALESGEIQPVGSAKTKEVRARVIAATDADLERAIEEGRFRAPLLHRLARYELRIPPLRERREDFGRLFYHFLSEELREVGRLGRLMESENPWPPARLVAQLAMFDWPGNVRQLRNMAGRLALTDPHDDWAPYAAVEETLGIVTHKADKLEKMRDVPATEIPTLPSEAPLPEDSSSSSAAGYESMFNAPTAELPTDDAATIYPKKSSPAVVPEDEAAAAPSDDGPVKYRKPSDVDEDELLRVLRENLWELKPAAETLGVSRASLYVLVEQCDQVRKASELSREEIEDALERTSGNPRKMVLELEVSRQGLKRRMTALGMDFS